MPITFLPAPARSALRERLTLRSLTLLTGSLRVCAASEGPGRRGLLDHHWFLVQRPPLVMNRPHNCRSHP